MLWGQANRSTPDLRPGTMMAKSQKKSKKKSAESPAQSPNQALTGEALLKETCRRIRAAKGLWDAHRNAACRGEREKALALYHQLSSEQKDKIPQQLRIWLRYRSEKYFGAHQTAPSKKGRSPKPALGSAPKPALGLAQKPASGSASG